jgi:hypothetical protein
MKLLRLNLEPLPTIIDDEPKRRRMLMRPRQLLDRLPALKP